METNEYKIKLIETHSIGNISINTLNAIVFGLDLFLSKVLKIFFNKEGLIQTNPLTKKLDNHRDLQK